MTQNDIGDHQRYFTRPPPTPFEYRKVSAHCHRLIGGAGHEAAGFHHLSRRRGCYTSD